MSAVLPWSADPSLGQCAKSVWPIFQKQKYGRIVTTCSQVGICALAGSKGYMDSINLAIQTAISGKQTSVYHTVARKSHAISDVLSSAVLHSQGGYLGIHPHAGC